MEQKEVYNGLSLCDADNNGITLQFTVDGRNISDFRISKEQAELIVKELQRYISKLPRYMCDVIKDKCPKVETKVNNHIIHGDIDLTELEAAYMKRHHRMQYRGEIKAYREGLLDMWNKLKG